MDIAFARTFGKRSMQFAACLLAGTLLGLADAAAAAPGAVVHTVAVEGMRFSPAVIEVNAGDTVIWQNKDPYPHTATSAGGGFDSGAMPPGGGWKLIAKKRGTFSYVCTFHPTMKASLVVK